MGPQGAAGPTGVELLTRDQKRAAWVIMLLFGSMVLLVCVLASGPE
jgi:hypothetical protein